MHQKNTTKKNYLVKLKQKAIHPIIQLKQKVIQRQGQSLKNRYLKQKKRLHNLKKITKYEDELIKLTKLRNDFILYMLKHDLMSAEKKAEIIPRKIEHLEFKNFDENVVRQLAKCRIAKKEQKRLFPVFRKLKRPTEKDIIGVTKHLVPDQFGYQKQYNYFYYQELMELVTEICRKNKWLDRQDWVAHKVPINKLTREFVHASKDYSEVKMYYAKLRFDKLTNQYKGKC